MNEAEAPPHELIVEWCHWHKSTCVYRRLLQFYIQSGEKVPGKFLSLRHIAGSEAMVPSSYSFHGIEGPKWPDALPHVSCHSLHSTGLHTSGSLNLAYIPQTSPWLSFCHLGLSSNVTAPAQSSLKTQSKPSSHIIFFTAVALCEMILFIHLCNYWLVLPIKCIEILSSLFTL